MRKSIEIEQNINELLYDLSFKVDNIIDISNILKKKSLKKQYIFLLRLSGYTHQEIATITRYSQQGINKILKREYKEIENIL